MEYANSVSNPHRKEDIEIIEKVQMRATYKSVKSVKHSSYEDRFKKIEIPTLKYKEWEEISLKYLKALLIKITISIALKFFSIRNK